VNEAYENLAQTISSAETNVTLNIANALWYRTGSELNPEFAAINQKFYRGTLGALDFTNPRSAQAMNEWASQNTHGKIQTIMQPPIPENTAIVLANAIYFKGTWSDPFDSKQTKERPFHSLPKSEQQLPMMTQTRSFSYQQGNGFQAVQLAYVGKRLHMQVFLPETNSSVEALLDRMDADFWRRIILPGFRSSRGTLVMPRFKLRFGAELKSTLALMGLKAALGPGADFSGMSSARLYLSEIKHQSFVEVNEEGTEAAAVTTGVMALASIHNPPPPFQMVVDRPFLFLITDTVTNSILFLGVVHDPVSLGP
jgi:serpin B